MIAIIISMLLIVCVFAKEFEYRGDGRTTTYIDKTTNIKWEFKFVKWGRYTERDLEIIRTYKLGGLNNFVVAQPIMIQYKGRRFEKTLIDPVSKVKTEYVIENGRFFYPNEVEDFINDLKMSRDDFIFPDSHISATPIIQTPKPGPRVDHSPNTIRVRNENTRAWHRAITNEVKRVIEAANREREVADEVLYKQPLDADKLNSPHARMLAAEYTDKINPNFANANHPAILARREEQISYTLGNQDLMKLLWDRKQKSDPAFFTKNPCSAFGLIPVP